MAIPLVLGFILVATLLGTTLLFLSKTRGADMIRIVGRFQHQHLTQMGISEALAIIKPLRITEVIAKRGPSWGFNTSHNQYGKATGWCEVKIETRGESELVITSTGIWQEPSAPPRRRKFSCVARYNETRSSDSNGYHTQVRIEGEWKIALFRERLPEANEE